MTHHPDPHARLVRVLAADAFAHAVHFDVIAIEERPWSSATFTGYRLTLALAITGGDPAPWLALLPEAELTVPNRIVADLVVRGDAARPMLEVLILDM